ncbi:putative peroxiredoxin bcp [Gracilariopsis chorda]|uniref:thioredoxin-dependent peroxiredoxin n=1 Tax=Gracilariopsis chorda TaxID=448386 RepID=A0A2V3IUY8_9FLOR|nr:putative peroxiredoxin bcp [Gracilariopsis chorda]|eukprot:PXF45931.1 putative peroxiredoxin bcp [Gracilariopsis chorda]
MTLPALPKLSTALLAKKKQVLDNMPEETVKGLEETSAGLAKVYTPNPLAKGDIAPDFTLKNASGEPIKLSDLLRDHSAVVLTWYRGGWCPYCNVALESLIAANEHIEALGAKLVALTPETPDESLSVIEKTHIPFHVLSDDGLFVAEKYGIAFTVTEEIKALYRTFGVDLDHMNGNDGNRKARLPLPASLVLDKEGKVEFVYANLDYTTRAEPSDIIDAIKSIVE